MKVIKTTPGSFGTAVNDDLVIIAEGDNTIDDSVWKELKKKKSIQDMLADKTFVVPENGMIEKITDPIDEDEYEDFNAGDAIEYIEEINTEEELLAVYKWEKNDKKRKTVIDKIYHMADELEIDIEE